MHLRLLTYNIHKCLGGIDGTFQPRRVSETIARHEPDVVLLQEVAEGTRHSPARQVDLIGDLLGMRHRAYAAHAKVLGGGRYGNAMLSRHPIGETRLIELSMPLSKRRGVLHARCDVRGRSVHVFNVHLGLAHFLRVRQLRRFLQSRPLVDLDPRDPVILAGDFNDVWARLGRKQLEPAGFRPMQRALRTFPSWAPIGRLDWVYVRGDISITDVRRPEPRHARWASDHLPVVADVKIG